jgi:recombinational DNA repair ATPase RecF
MLFILKMAQHRITEKKSVILLDDIFSELDNEYASIIIKYLRENCRQVIITCHSQLQWQYLNEASTDNLIKLF